ncbi:sensor histidine kinase [Evansella cellulosilytica]|uniref:histidine kinase n=1 Tax=Evansella cellulosilytica (strain ATCC 21833 / DSM 2522 / FERM P-1141 / JCM 9156 / N-4) TaxID=649639 RepID=E6TXH4_EVAC2|nr:HAMP domain-containing sensor histidine kinase [Evansella cellulosilytica]ADU28788.1 integral membrane sensor signal transduction histidine kinase [Evansella cellulosilytica DSM 2522]
MLRNKEFQILLVIMIFISIAATAATLYFSVEAAIIVAITTILLIVSTIAFTIWRYREIRKLSSYLRKISSGDYSLDVRDNKEGELSILKNDIYKVTLMLSEQRAVLMTDKSKLTDAISDISHQLKTPITSMMVMSDLLSDSKLTAEKKKEFTRNIRVQLERIEWLVSSLLKLSKIDARTIQFKRDTVQVKQLIDKAVDPIRIPMDIQEQTLSIVGEETVSFIGDLNWSAEALLNILKNCVEHTKSGGNIHITFSENALFTEIIIRDNGVGIAKEDVPYIFKRFYKGKNASDESVGIGLAMAHSIITSQNGTIEVQSECNSGTTFNVKFYKQVI